MMLYPKTSKFTEKNIPKRKISLFEKILGFLCFFVFIIQIYYKGQTQKLIFILNPCHVSIVRNFLVLIIQVTFRDYLFSAA